ncbi:Alpha/Beta hydrolase protein [Aspergillus varians]
MMLCTLMSAILVVNVVGLQNDPQAVLTHDSLEFLPSSYGRLANEKTSLTLLFQNNLNSSDDENHAGAILLDPMGQHDLRDACEEIGESMISISTITEHKQDFLHLFLYLFYARGQAEENERALFYIRSGVLSVTRGDQQIENYPFPSRNMYLPVLCTQTRNNNEANGGENAQRQLVRVASDGNIYIGSRNQKSFRFLGIPYADPHTRFSLAVPYSAKSRTIHATEYGPDCVQVDGGSENCLYLNIHTPYIPKRNSTTSLRPVMFWIHGGDFTAGTGSDPVTDGGNLASREDMVVVTFNYRLSTLGFLAVPETDIRGNYGIADQVLALEWTIQNIAQFGGDPHRITIIGEGAGASSVKALLGSPAASGKFQGAIAMSDRGSGAGIETEGGEASHSSYLSILESYRTTGQTVFAQAGCNEGTIEEQISCLREIPASTLGNLPTVARHVVQDGEYVNTTELNLIERDAGTAPVPVIFGNTAHEGASFVTYPSSNIQTELDGLQESLGITTAQAQRILDSRLFSSPNTDNKTLNSFEVSQRIATDTQIRCPNQASLFAGASSSVFNLSSSYYYQMHRTTGGIDPNNLGGPPPSPDFPNGDPDLPYFRLHGADLPFIFGNLNTIRDPLDLYAAQLISSYFAEFIRSGQPNPNTTYLAARGYQKTLAVVSAFDSWEPVQSPEGPIQILDFPPRSAPFQDLEQCEFLGYSITHYLDQAGVVPLKEK